MASDLTGLVYSRPVVRRHPAREHGCVLCPRTANGWDHCHRHGLIRGPLCLGCNGALSLADAGMRTVWRVGGWEGLTNEGIAEYRARCPGCAGEVPPAIPEDMRMWASRTLADRWRELRWKVSGAAGADRRNCHTDCPVAQFVCGVPMAASGLSYV